MIDLYSWCTPNGQKVSIMLEETGLSYRAHPVNIGAGEQFKPAFLAISPNHRIPAIIDQDGPGGKALSLFESGAILLYLAEKTGQFLPAERHARYTALQWLFWQMGGVGPMFGQANHFRNYATQRVGAEAAAYGVERYTNEARRLFGVMDTQLSRHEWLGGDTYSIADMATWPWIVGRKNFGIDIAEYPHVGRWNEAMKARPGVRRGFDVLRKERDEAPANPDRWNILFGAEQARRR